MLVFENVNKSHNKKINEFLIKENIENINEILISERKNETEKSFIYFLKLDNEVYQLTINKESGNLMPRKGNYKMDEYKWLNGKEKRKNIIEAFKSFITKK